MEKNPSNRKRRSEVTSLEVIKEIEAKQDCRQMEAEAKGEQQSLRAERQMDQMLSILDKLVDHMIKQ